MDPGKVMASEGGASSHQGLFPGLEDMKVRLFGY